MKKIWLSFFCMLFVIACSNDDSNGKNTGTEIKVAAASDLTKAFREIGQQFEKQTGTQVKFIFESSGQLKEQIENGAPYDVYIAANVQYVNDLKEKQLIVTNSDRIWMLGRIGIATKEDDRLNIQTLNDLVKPEVKKIAIANPTYAPYGFAAKQALQHAGIWNQVKDKLVFAKNISDTITYVDSENVEAGIVSLSLVQDEKLHFHVIDETFHDPIQQTMAIVKGTKNKEAAQEFCDFLHGSTSKKIMGTYGYVIPEGT